MSLGRVGLFTLLLFLLCIVPAAQGHAVLLIAKPARGQVVSGSRVEINLRFNSRIDAQRSRLSLVDPDGEQHSLTIGQQLTPESLTSEATSLRAGDYVLRWQVLAADGHISRGEVPFNVR